MHHEDSTPKTEIEKYLDTFPLTTDSKEFVLHFATDHMYEVYTLVYRFAGAYLASKYKQSKNPQNMLEEIYTLPTTPDML